MKKKAYEKYSEDDNSFVYDEKISKSGIFIKQDCELYHDEDNVPGAIVRVKRNSTKAGDENWKITVNNEEFLVLKGSRFTEKEREFLRGPSGMLFIMDGAKKGWDSVSEFKRQLKVGK